MKYLGLSGWEQLQGTPSCARVTVTCPLPPNYKELRSQAPKEVGAGVIFVL